MLKIVEHFLTISVKLFKMSNHMSQMLAVHKANGTLVFKASSKIDETWIRISDMQNRVPMLIVPNKYNNRTDNDCSCDTIEQYPGATALMIYPSLTKRRINTNIHQLLVVWVACSIFLLSAMLFTCYQRDVLVFVTVSVSGLCMVFF